MAITTNCLMFDNQQLLYDGTGVLYNYEPRIKFTVEYKLGVVPKFYNWIWSPVATQISVNPNIWDVSEPNVPNYHCTNWQYVFFGYGEYSHSGLLEVISADNTSLIKNTNGMFTDCKSLNKVCLFDTSNVENMFGMFAGCTSLKTIPEFNTINTTTMGSMFQDCSSLSGIPQLNTCNVTAMNQMFYDCENLKAIPLLDTSKVVTLHNTFAHCVNVESGMSAFYQQASTQANPPTKHSYAFLECGINTPQGAAELAMIPNGWK